MLTIGSSIRLDVGVEKIQPVSSDEHGPYLGDHVTSLAEGTLTRTGRAMASCASSTGRRSKSRTSHDSCCRPLSSSH